MEHKSFIPQIKRADEGSALVVISTLNTIDKDLDVTKAGFFGEQHVQVVGAHDWRSIPIGKSRIYELGNEALAEIKFNDTSAGQDWYRAIKFDKENGIPKQEYSYGFLIRPGGSQQGVVDGKSVRFLGPLSDGSPGGDVIEVSPVLRGAGEGTRTLDIKADKLHQATRLNGAVPAHTTAMTETPWDGPAQERRVKSSAEAHYFEAIYAWADPHAADRTSRAGWKFPHHLVLADGTAGDASIRACHVTIGLLNGARGGTTIPDADRHGVYAHLAAHLRDAGIEPPALKDPQDEAGVKLDDQSEWTLWDLESLVLRYGDVEDVRIRNGKSPLSAMCLTHIGQIKEMLARLEHAAAAATDPAIAAQDEEVKAVLARYEELQSVITR
jgi:hypothetical protein